MKRFVPYGKQHIDEGDIDAVVRALKSDFITQGPRIREFEEKLAAYCGAQYAAVLNSGTSALHAAYFAAGLKEGGEVITSPITFVATANAALYLGARPVFVDVEPDTGNINPELLEKAITDDTRVVAPVHYAGHPVDLETIDDMAKRSGLVVIEDACHALGSEFKGERTGSCKYSDMAVFSFHPLKHITTAEGGAVLTNNEEFYKKIQMFRTHGITKDRESFMNESDGEWYHEMQLLGYNYRMTDIQAALGISQLGKLDRFVERRRDIARTYSKAFADNPYFDLPVEKSYADHSWHLYPIRLRDADKRKAVFERLREEGLGVQVHYIPVYLQPYYGSMGYESGLCPLSEDFYRREISIPIYHGMGDEDVEYVLKTLPKVLEGFK